MKKAKDDALVGQLVRALGDVPKSRVCLRCETSFWSEGFGQRICSKCKASAEWRAAVPEGINQGRRRPGGRST